MRIILAALAVFYLSVAGFGQSGQSPAPQQPSEGQSITGPGITGLPLSRGIRPKITLQDSLKLAESYLKKEKIDVSTFFLSEARMIQYGGEKEAKEPRWLFTWIHESGVGLTMQFTVSMSGKVARQPSL